MRISVVDAVVLGVLVRPRGHPLEHRVEQFAFSISESHLNVSDTFEYA